MWAASEKHGENPSPSVLLTLSGVRHTCDLAEDPFRYDLSEPFFFLNHVLPVCFITGVLHISMGKKGRAVRKDNGSTTPLSYFLECIKKKKKWGLLLR